MQYECEECGESYAPTEEPKEKELLCPQCGGRLRRRVTLADRASASMSPSVRRRYSARQHADNGDFATLARLGRIFSVLGWLFAMGAFFGAVAMALNENWPAAGMCALFGFFSVVSYLATGEIIRLFIYLEGHSRRSAEALDEIGRLLSSRSAADR